MRFPRHDTVPAVGSRSLRINFPVVDLPQPLSPTRPSVSPCAIEKLTSSTAWTWALTREKTPLRTGKCLVRFFTSRSTAGKTVRPEGGTLILRLHLHYAREERAESKGERPRQDGRSASTQQDGLRPSSRAAGIPPGSAR